jgi:hypothetical protein
MDDWDAKDAGVPNHWQLYVDPSGIDFDLFDIADIVRNILDDALDAAIDGLLGPLPGWAKDLVRAILGPIIDVIADVLDFGDDFAEWLADLIGVNLGFFDLILGALADFFAADRPIVEIEEPLPALPATPSLIPVLIPIEHLGVTVTETEMVLTVDVGA